METRTFVYVDNMHVILRGGIEIEADHDGVGVVISHYPYIGQRAYVRTISKPNWLEVETV